MISVYVISLDYVIQTSINSVKENGYTVKKRGAGGRRYLAATYTDAGYADDQALLANTLPKANLVWFGLVSLLNCISTFEGYLMLKLSK